jgi:hypothetical protein
MQMTNELKLLANSELRLDLIPEVDDDRSLVEFALTFDGYSHYGGFEACADICNADGRSYFADGSLPRSMSELRACLFFEQRRWHHCGEAPDAEAKRYMGVLLDAIRDRIAKGDIA